MVLQKTVEKLRDRPRHERRAIARGIAMLVVLVLFIAWVIFFFNNIRANGIQIQPIDIPVQEALNTPQAEEAKAQIQNSFGGVKDSLQAIQNNAAAQDNDSQSEVPANTAY